MDKMKILMAASEAIPYMKTGGLADVVGSLPKYFDKDRYDAVSYTHLDVYKRQAPIRGSSFLCIVCIIQQYLGSSAIRSRERACTSRAHGMKPLAL